MIRTAAGVVLAACMTALGVSPAAAYKVITVETPDCARCRVTIESNDNRDYGFYQLRHGRTTIYLNDRITSFALGVETAEGFSGIASQTVVAFQYKGFSAGEKVTSRQSRWARKARICHAPVDGETLRFRVKRVPIPKSYFKRKGVIPPMPGQKHTLRVWASPTMSAVDPYDSTYKGVTGIQNDVCGSLPYQ